MIEELKRICSLQPAYASENTPEMQERGTLIRHGLPDALRAMSAELADLLGPFGEDLGVEGSDGIGRKTEAPWVRIFSGRMSPAATDGYYVVLHFARDGSAVFVTVGFGSTVWSNGELLSVSDRELLRRRLWSRGVIAERFGGLAPFEDEIVLGARAKLPRTFEKATSIARRVPVEKLQEDLVRDLILAATARLREVYNAEAAGRDMTMADLAEQEIQAIARPLARTGRGQGFGLTVPQRVAVERRAMAVARDWLEAEGYRVTDTSANRPYDLLAERDDGALKVEVKGTTGDRAETIFMTHNEVELHLSEAGATALMIVSRIVLSEPGATWVGEGGELTAEVGWDIESWDRLPLAYRLTRT